MAGQLTRDIGDINPIVSITQAVESREKADILGAVGKIGGDLFKQKVLSDFKEQIATIEADFEQRGNSAEANLRASAITKSFENKHPYFSREFRQITGGSGGRGGNSGIFPQTLEEKIDDALAMDQAKFEQQQEQEAEKVGMSKDAYVALQHENEVNQATINRVNALVATGGATSSSVLQGTEAGLNMGSLALSGEVFALTKKQGGLNPEDVTKLTQKINSLVAAAHKNYTDGVAGQTIETKERNAAFANIEKHRTAMLSLMKSGTLEEIYKNKMSLVENVTKYGNSISMPDVYAASLMGDSVVTTLLQLQGSPEFNALMEKHDPKFRLVKNARETGAYVTKQLAIMNGTPEIVSPDSPVELSEGEDNALSALATSILNGSSYSKEQYESAAKYLASKVESVGIDSFNAWDTDLVQRRVNTSPELATALEGAYTTLVADLAHNLGIKGDDLRRISALEREERTVPRGTGRWRGRVKAGEEKIVKYQFVMARPESTQKYRGPRRTVSSTTSAVPSRDKLDLLISIAERYPKIVRGGKSMEEWGEEMIKLFNPVTKEDETTTEFDDVIDLTID